MHKRDQESILINALADGHTILTACRKAGVSRQLFYRLLRNNHKFRKEVSDAQIIGRDTNDDLIKTMHMKKVRDEHWPSIQYGLKKIDAKELAEKKNATNNPSLMPGDVRELIETLPEPYKSKHMGNLRDLLSDVSIAFNGGLSKDIDTLGI